MQIEPLIIAVHADDWANKKYKRNSTESDAAYQGFIAGFRDTMRLLNEAHVIGCKEFLEQKFSEVEKLKGRRDISNDEQAKAAYTYSALAHVLKLIKEHEAL